MKDDVKNQFRENYLRYASYVILDRAIPSVVDGLKPVQRRILWTLFKMDDGKLHKVANVAGQTMALHPHGDAPIVEALVNVANKKYLLERQGNFGNPHTGDPAAAARYIETKLSDLAKEALFNPQLTTFVPSYDGRNEEPVVLPAKIPLLLMQGAEGIAVGMATKIFPHNFCELLEAQIALLEGKKMTVLPDFPSGGIMDASNYDCGRGKIKLRAKIDILDEKTLVVREICQGTNTEGVIRSIDDAAKKGKIKIEAINDYTAEKIEIEIKLPRGQYAKKCIETLYAFTDLEISLSSQIIAIYEGLPREESVDEILERQTGLVKGYLKAELEIERDRLTEKIFEKTLEQIFIENRLYKEIEEIKSYEKVHETIAKSLLPFHKKLIRVPTKDDREKLLSIPIRRISRFDIDKNQDEIVTLDEKLQKVEKDLKNIKRFTIHYLKSLLKKYGPLFPRRTKIETIELIDKRAISERTVKVGYDPETGFLGTKVSAEMSVECSSLDKLLVLFEDGTYRVIQIPEKLYAEKAIWIGPADKKTVLNVISRDTKTNFPYVKRFVVKQFIIDKVYTYLEEGKKLEYLSSDSNAVLQLLFKAKPKQKVKKLEFSFEEVAPKGAGARGLRIANKELRTIKLCK
ncbi:MAG: DNA gyrase subunit A [Chlamydiales bacterium]|nr:DNA gyrase subunit A [Chlamydiales bacterium]MCH9619387.1 DNA gyrase subunit A [Chlamydiales bacterium]MCH9622191.1 DNA gyrase subunit A [Chlamydiales bacterium]